jgi:hypothetical protein
MLVRTGGNRCVRRPSSEADLTRGGVSPRARRTSPEGRFAALPRWAVGATTVPVVLCACVRLEVSLRFAFFAGFKRDSLGCLGDPYGCPRQVVLLFCEVQPLVVAETIYSMPHLFILP